jgi:quercetin dioxygenase-like cupin family protein
MLESRPMKHRWLFLPLLAFAVLAAAQATAPIIEITAEPSHHQLFENQYARAFKIDLAPHAAMLLHHHRHDYIFVVLSPSSIENDIVGQAPFLRKFQEGETVFVPGPFAHTAKNLQDKPFQVIAVEIMKTDPAQLSHKWDEERGLHILNGGTLDFLFVKDGVRAADVQLNPGGVVPKHHHNGPHVVVAITDLNLRTDIEGGGTTNVQLKAGDAVWVKGGVTHTVTNIGSQNARLITLEFP